MPAVALVLSTLHRTSPSWSADTNGGPTVEKRLAVLRVRIPLLPLIPTVPPGAEVPLSSVQELPSLEVPQPLLLSARTNVSARGMELVA
jgi:hypothetical protein